MLNLGNRYRSFYWLILTINSMIRPNRYNHHPE